ncbi:BadF/BadG/BcrA/BcrD ATPase family protein [Falsirhodobacter algicola]|uniref:ATPase n=1 Tax=Falsirhodobacter algicola TaxID=2692330 RepID=A0A8J8MV36_9RHOB|nr:BadF/BadG/BcrA/BcrD ATPase family protein [Falsirhodobacter algicola]QUS37262.1 ATPase [Falsirhodobacter algicola]
MPPPVIAVDGGGTRCRLSYDGRTEIEIGPTNVVSDRAGSIRRLTAGLSDLIARAGGRVAPVYLGLAGCIADTIAQDVARSLPFPILAVEDDRKAALRGALGQGDGAVVHCGTGSFFGLCRDGAVRLAGGWGSILGDEASAHWVARRALSLTLECEDGLRTHSDLSRDLLERLGGSSGIVAFAMTAGAARTAELAPFVTAAAAAGDSGGTAVMREGAAHIAATLAQMGYRPPMALCLTGGIGAQFAAFLPPEIAARLRPAAGRPIDGALALARGIAADDREARHVR